MRTTFYRAFSSSSSSSFVLHYVYIVRKIITLETSKLHSYQQTFIVVSSFKSNSFCLSNLFFVLYFMIICFSVLIKHQLHNYTSNDDDDDDTDNLYIYFNIHSSSSFILLCANFLNSFIHFFIISCQVHGMRENFLMTDEKVSSV